MNATTETAVLGSFSMVDQTPDAAALVAALDDQASIPAIQRLRAAATDFLGARLGHRIVDVGCGTGEVARAIAQRVGRTGHVIGIDNSETMLAVARQRVASAIDADRWISQLADAGQQGRFFWTLTMFAVAGTRPPASPCPTDHRRENR